MVEASLLETLASNASISAEANPAGFRLVVGGFETLSAVQAVQAALVAARSPEKPPEPVTSPAIKVANTAELLAALASSKPGAHIVIAAGRYSKVSIRAPVVMVDGPVTISGEGAVLTDLLVQGQTGLNFEDLVFEVDPAGVANPFMVRQSDNIHFRRLDVHGSLNGDPTDDKSGIFLRESRRVSVTGSEFQQLFTGVSHQDCAHLDISGNSFHDLQMDGVRGGGSSFVTVNNNTLTDFHPLNGQHPDAIQFWGDKTLISPGGPSVRAPVRKIEVRGNVITRGKGGICQGIFLRDGTGLYGFEDVVIEDNLVVGTMFNGIAIENGKNVRIAGNTVTGAADMKSWISIEKVTGLDLRDNAAQLFLIEEKEAKTPPVSNRLIPPSTDGGAALRAVRNRA